MSNWMVYLLLALVLVESYGIWRLWHASGTEKAVKATVTPAEPTYRIREKWGTYHKCLHSTEMGDHWGLSAPGVYFIVSERTQRGGFQDIFYCDELKDAEAHLVLVVERARKRNMVRPVYQFRKDGTPYSE